MIVTCTSCQSRFRIPDERIGAKGAKVRCSKCKNVFAVAPPADAPRPQSAADPFAAAGFGAAPLPAPGSPPAPSGGPDPFAQASDPFAAMPAADPFAAAAAPPADLRAGGTHLPVTDLSDLGGSPGGASSAPAPPGEVSPLSPQAPGSSEPGGPLASADDLVLEERTPGRGLRAGPPPLPGGQGPGLDLGAGSGQPVQPGAAGLGASPETPFAFGAYDLGGPEPDLGGEAAGAIPAAASFGADPFGAPGGPGEPALGMGPGELPGRTVTEPVAPQPPPPPPMTRPAVAARRPSDAAPAGVSLRAPPRRNRTQSLPANAVSLAALLAVAAGILALWRGEGRFGALLGGWRRSAAVEVALAGSGLYERVRGRPVLFVRGNVVSHSRAPLGRVVVRAELVQGGAVLARSEGLAGALPTPEDLAQLDGPDGEARLQAALAPRAPSRIEPGGSLPFLLTFAEYPEDLGGVSFQVSAEPAAAGPARSP